MIRLFVNWAVVLVAIILFSNAGIPESAFGQFGQIEAAKSDSEVVDVIEKIAGVAELMNKNSDFKKFIISHAYEIEEKDIEMMRQHQVFFKYLLEHPEIVTMVISAPDARVKFNEALKKYEQNR